MSGRIAPRPSSGIGIYHLMLDEQVVYVGQSANMLARIGNWVSSKAIDFDGYRFFPCEIDQLNALEREHIGRYKPQHNIAGNTWHFQPVPRYGYLSDDELAQEIERSDLHAVRGDLIPGGAICRLTKAASNLSMLLEVVAMGAFPAPVRQEREGGAVYWRRSDVAAWLRAGRRWPAHESAA
jgi:hypothetical protein